MYHQVLHAYEQICFQADTESQLSSPSSQAIHYYSLALQHVGFI